jgi:prepilin-type N-terminal cleavage/methylation domain-containing protein
MSDTNVQCPMRNGPVASSATLRELKRGVCSSNAAFTLIEMLVTVSLLAIIILGLTAMFSQTRRAFTSSMAQVDVLEAGRATADLISRDLEQMTPAYYSNVPNFYVITSGSYGQTSGLLQEQLANPTDIWTNIIQEMVFLTPSQTSNGQWTAVGYRLQFTDEQNSIGSLYRFNASGLTITNNANGPGNFSYETGANGFLTTAPLNIATNFNRIIDGVTYFRVLAYKTNGVLITNGNFNTVKTINVKGGFYPGYDYDYSFTSNATPAYVEVELGVLETQAYQKYLSFLASGAATGAANTYLTTHPGAIHIFRQRIPIRDLDPTTAFY